MKITQTKEIIDPYEWLPPYGENMITCHNVNKDFILEIWFDSEDSEIKKTITFKSAVWSSLSAFPGINIDTISYPEYKNIDCLVELIDSLLAKRWSEHFENRVNFHHFQIYFLSANKKVEVVCESVDII